MSKANTFLSIILIGAFWLFDVHIYVANQASAYMNAAKAYYLNIYLDVSNTIERYSQNVDYIKELQNQTKINNKYKILYKQSLDKIKQLEDLLKITSANANTSNFQLVSALSYKEFNNPTSLILDVHLNEEDKIYPLLDAQNYVAGIVVQEGEQSVAYLNEHKLCSYTVDIGSSGVTGVMGGYAPEYNSTIIKHIPKYSNVKAGDIVSTNGLGNIFFSGIKVGVITKVYGGDSTLTASVKTYANNKENYRFFYIYKDAKKLTAIKPNDKNL